MTNTDPRSYDHSDGGAVAKRLVVKVDTEVISRNGSHRLSLVATLVEQLENLVRDGCQVVLVSGEAACISSAKAGDGGVLALFSKLFSLVGMKPAVLTATSLALKCDDGAQRVKAQAEELFASGCVPIVVEPVPDDNNAELSALALAAQLVRALKADLLVDVCAEGAPAGVHTYSPACHGAAAQSQVVQDCWAVATGGVDVLLVTPQQLGPRMAGEVEGALFSVDAARKLEASAWPGAAAQVQEAAMKARAASRVLQSLPSEVRDGILERVAARLLEGEDEIMAANGVDVAAAEGHISPALMQRLQLKHNKMKQVALGIQSIAAQPEPVGRVLARTELAEGLVLDKVTSPIGVLLVIFEARPDALPQIAALAIRSSNGLLLKGGKEAAATNRVLHRIIVNAIQEVAPEVGADLIVLVETRAGVDQLLKLHHVIDLVIPRGSNQLVSYIQSNTKIPVLGHADGICHLYIDEECDMDKAIRLAVDSKVDYPAACNAVEKILVHKALHDDGRIVRLMDSLKAAGVSLYGGQGSAQLLGLLPAPAERHEYSDLAVTLEVVDSLAAAIAHIHDFGSGHTDAIATSNPDKAEEFLNKVDAACVFANASTRFSDGFRFGLGAEVGISTGRIHARGPVGVEGLLTTRWLLRGGGQVVAKDEGVVYTHKPLSVGS